MKAKTVKIDTAEAANEKLLMGIVQREKDIKLTRESLKKLEEQHKEMLQEAIEKKIEKAGEYKLVCKATTRKSVDMAAVRSMLDDTVVLEIATIYLKDAENYLTKKQIESCTTKTVSSTYKVIECYEPGGKALLKSL